MAKSDLIAIGEIIDVSRGSVREVEGHHGRRQEVNVVLELKQILLGEALPRITIHAYSTSYIEDGTAYSSTAGFSDYDLEKNEKYLAFLVRRNGRYYLASDSNQFLEHVIEANNRIRADGQTGQYVDLRKKLKRVAKFAKKKSQHADAANP